jgi:hypothetical protein
VAGEPALDRVVTADGASQYAALIEGARSARFHDSGHLGYITKPDVFRRMVAEFLDGSANAAA